jgi:hypothetical protein
MTGGDEDVEGGKRHVEQQEERERERRLAGQPSHGVSL